LSIRGGYHKKGEEERRTYEEGRRQARDSGKKALNASWVLGANRSVRQRGGYMRKKSNGNCCNSAKEIASHTKRIENRVRETGKSLSEKNEPRKGKKKPAKREHKPESLKK